MTLSVLSVASEAFPLIKTGGLADVVGALPAALAPHDIAVTTLIPGFPKVMRAIGDAPRVHHWPHIIGTDAWLRAARIGEHRLLVLDAPHLYAREGLPYVDSDGHDWHDNWRRFAVLARAGADLTSGAVPGFDFDLLHAHDWQAALAPAFLHYAPGPGPVARSIVTIHNIAFQGSFAAHHFADLGLPPRAWSIDGVEYYGQIGYLKAGLRTADAITTVSPTYAEEIHRPQYGMGLEGLIAQRAACVSGIVNGIDPAIWNPGADTALAAPFTVDTLDDRIANKRAVEALFGLEQDDRPIFTVISRLTWQKGMDVLVEVIDDLVAMGGRLVVLGSGDPALEIAFAAAALRHPGRVAARIGYDEPVSHLLQGGCDAILIPSRFEPCGLTQLYGLAYGCVPVVARTGGLADTIIDANEAALTTGVATGLQFDDVTPDTIVAALRRAMRLHAGQDRWRIIQVNGMNADYSWRQSGRHYAELYRSVLGYS
ncbi:glycogen synthase GlgA [Sphingomonadaceae bacterium jetA1]|jgi:starch synthase|uniref:glycogen synthase GlgA n=1 Tax=Facivitalis istanbulensis TaxID=3075838 RepID=UPI00348FACCF